MCRPLSIQKETITYRANIIAANQSIMSVLKYSRAFAGDKKFAINLKSLSRNPLARVASIAAFASSLKESPVIQRSSRWLEAVVRSPFTTIEEYPKFIVSDRDGIYGEWFGKLQKESYDITLYRTPPRMPNCNGFIE